MSCTRVESNSFGPVEVSESVPWGAQIARGLLFYHRRAAHAIGVDSRAGLGQMG